MEETLNNLRGAAGQAPQTQQLEQEEEMLVWRQVGSIYVENNHDNIYTFVLLERMCVWKPIFTLVETRYVNADDKGKYTYMKVSKLAELEGKVIKRVHDYSANKRRKVEVEYYVVAGSKLVKLKFETGLRDENGFFDRVFLPDGRKLIVRRDRTMVEVE